ncbi:sulfatase-like hydrolase/transferase [Haloplanus litoreus]|uniref:sulfatase-like hydrolase/transferase n=1 Tax=Haloplanus litoreus TaxID=767515 RepID=UPI00361BD65B
MEYHTPKYPAEAVTDWALSELTQKPPSFLWAHYMDAHKPFNPENAISPPDANVSKETLEYLNDYDRMDDPPEKKCRHYLKALYEANVRYVDREIARLLRELRAFDWYSDALVVLVSDHGELFGEYGHMWHPMTIDPVDELIDVPLAVKFPQGERAGKVVDHRVQHADIPATIGTYLQQTDLSPEGTYPLLDSAERIILSKSNTSIRVTGSDGHVIRRRDDSRDEYGDISDELWERAETAEFPDVRTSNGVVRGLEDVDRMEQLKALGYR